MHIYFSGIGGVGIGPLAEIAHDAGYHVSGSDNLESQLTEQLEARGIAVVIGQAGSGIARIHRETPIDWFVYTAALPDDHPELTFARSAGIRASKRDELIATIIKEKKLKLIAVAGTHGKTTTTGLLIWAFKQLCIPVSYSIGTTLSFGTSGHFEASSHYFVYECDEYDRNFLHYEPSLSLITALSYDHPDTYKNEHEYKNAFVQFMTQSQATLLWEKDLHFLAQPDIPCTYEAYDELMNLSHLHLAGDHVRHNAFLVERALHRLSPDTSHKTIVEALNSFPGTNRRFEKLGENLYSDYGHHPAEIAATLQLARELSNQVVLVYQPHQNVRQHQVREQYTNCMQDADTIYWLPTYLSREDPSLPVLTPEELSSTLKNRDHVHVATMNGSLWEIVQAARNDGKLVVIMGAGSVDAWARQCLAETK